MICVPYIIAPSRIPGAGQGLFLTTPVSAGRILIAPTGIEHTLPLDAVLASTDPAIGTVRFRQDGTVTFRAETDPGKVEQPIRITTDRGENIYATLDAYAEVVSPVNSASAESETSNEPAAAQQASVGS